MSKKNKVLYLQTKTMERRKIANPLIGGGKSPLSVTACKSSKSGSYASVAFCKN